MPYSLLNILVNFLWLLVYYSPIVSYLLFIMIGKKIFNCFYINWDNFAKLIYSFSNVFIEFNCSCDIFSKFTRFLINFIRYVLNSYYICMGKSCIKPWLTHKLLLPTMFNTSKIFTIFYGSCIIYFCSFFYNSINHRIYIRIFTIYLLKKETS